MEQMTNLGHSPVCVPRLGVGAMTWGEPKGLARFTPAKLAYGSAHGAEEERRAFEVSLAAGVTLFDTAAMYSNGASEQRLGELAHGKDVLIASKFPGTLRFKVENFPKELEASLRRLGRSTIDLYQHHFPSKSISIPELMELVADAVEAGKVKAVGVSNYTAEQMRIAHAALAKRGIPLASNQVQYSLAVRKPDRELIPYAATRDRLVIAYSPLAKGLLSGRYDATNLPKDTARRNDPLCSPKAHRCTDRVENDVGHIGRMLRQEEAKHLDGRADGGVTAGTRQPAARHPPGPAVRQQIH